MSIFTDSKEFLRNPVSIIKDRVAEVYWNISSLENGINAMRNAAKKTDYMRDSGTLFETPYKPLIDGPNKPTIKHDIVAAGLAAMEVEQPAFVPEATESKADEGIETARANVEAAYESSPGVDDGTFAQAA